MELNGALTLDGLGPITRRWIRENCSHDQIRDYGMRAVDDQAQGT